MSNAKTILSTTTNLDPLLYATMPLNLSGDQIASLGSRNQMGYNTASDIAQFDTLLSNTAIKRACCMGKSSIGVKIPIPADFSGYKSTGNTNYNYIEKTVNVTSDMCGTYTSGSEMCDKFMDTYCTNVKNDLTTLNGGTYDSTKFVAYSPECACYGEKLAIASEYNYPPKAYMLGCESGKAYLDKSSRDSSLTIVDCSIVNEYSNLDAGENINFSGTKITQQCGLDSSSSSTTSSSGASSTTKSSSTGTTGTSTGTTSGSTTGSTIGTSGTSNTTSSSSSYGIYAIIGGAGSSILLCCVCIILIGILLFTMR